MLAPKVLPLKYQHWNQSHGAPYGRFSNLFFNLKVRFPSLERRIPYQLRALVNGPFGLQGNNTTRTFEYPWAYHSTELAKGMKVVEVGGGYSGLQFALSKAGCKVTNIDPSSREIWKYDTRKMSTLNRIFGTDVELLPSTIQDANLDEGEYDRVFAISVLEHLKPEHRREAMSACYRCLKPGGKLVATIDLFLNLTPFCSRTENEFGTNANIKELTSEEPWLMLEGETSQLHGYDEFDHQQILCDLEKYYIGRYPAMAQCIVLQKPLPRRRGHK